ncbi:MAG TPA: 3-phosphoshikimate 1-carboxyvinyltransferase [Thermoanaerobaculia bacterium]|nr:3-phosphoshikimate 1-carboxyvinyltransferase [Thermoanaerobaculia bacterium]
MTVALPDAGLWRRLARGERVELPDPLPIPAGGRAAGRVEPPPSKSVSHRYLNLALLAGRPVRVERLLAADDLDLFVAALRGCERSVRRAGEVVEIGAAGEASRTDEPVRIDCGNAGTMFRFLTASLAAIPGRFVLDGSPRLRERPIAPLVAALRELGAEVSFLAVEGHAPLAIEGGTLVGGRCALDASQSSQYLSALLMAGARAAQPLEIVVTALRSDPYVDVTLAALAAFGLDLVRREGRSWRVRPATRQELAAGPSMLRVEADYSAVAYPAAAAALTGGDVWIQGVERSSAQGDRIFLDVLAEMGAAVDWRGDALRVRGGRLRAVDVDFSSLPDQVPTLAALACFADGTTHIRNVAHLRWKESDRLGAVALEFRESGFSIEEAPDALRIVGRPTGADTRPVVVDSHDDHRIAMSLALVGLRRPGLAVAAPGVVAKSYPGFWRDLATLLTPD